MMKHGRGLGDMCDSWPLPCCMSHVDMWRHSMQEPCGKETEETLVMAYRARGHE